jgi:hypothetical protein
VDNRHWPYEPYDPSARPPPRDEDSGWVVAGEEPAGQAPPPRNARPAGPPRQYGEQPASDPWPANRYPPQGYPPPGYDPRPRPPPYQGSYGTRRRAWPPPQPWTDEEPEEEPRPTLAPAVTWTIAAYLLPMLLYLAWAFTRSGVVPAGCLDASGAPCPPPRVEAAENLLSVLPALVGALVLALLIAVGLRRLATGWRAGSVGLAAAVIGGGFATVVTAILN